MLSLDGITNLSRKSLFNSLKTYSDEVKYAVLFLYGENHMEVCERFLENNAVAINNKSNIQIPFLTRYTKDILEKLRGQVQYEAVANHFLKNDGKVNSFEIMRRWARTFDDFELDDYNQIVTPTFVIISSKDINNPIVFPSKCKVNELRNNFNRINDILWSNYTNYDDVYDALYKLIDSRQNKKNHEKHDITLNYQLYTFVDDKRIFKGYNWEALNRNLAFRNRSTLQNKLKHTRITRMQLITIGFILEMSMDEINNMLFLGDSSILNEGKEVDRKIINCLDHYFERDCSMYDKIKYIQSELGVKLPVNCSDDAFD